MPQEVAQAVELEDEEGGAGTAKVASFCFLEEAVAEADEAENEGDMDAGDQREQAGVTPEVVSELMERT